MRRKAEDIIAFDLGRNELDYGHPRRIEPLHEQADQRGFAGADFAGHDDEAFCLLQAIAQIRHRLFVRAAFEPESRVGRQREGRCGQAVMIGVTHCVNALPLKRVPRAELRCTDKARFDPFDAVVV